MSSATSSVCAGGVYLLGLLAYAFQYQYIPYVCMGHGATQITRQRQPAVQAQA
jgi:hypothetical protein